MRDWIELDFYGNTLLDWLIAGGIGLGALLLMLAARGLVGRKLRAVAQAERFRASSALGIAADLVGRVTWLFLAVLAVYLAAYTLELPVRVRQALDAALAVVIFLQLALLGTTAFVAWTESYVRRRGGDPAIVTTLGAVRFLGQVVIWALALLLALDNLGFDVTALVAGLGIGGIAVAFALQNVLGDIFASVSIILDKPFEVGDFIILGEVMGTVERVGIKTTRLRSLSGEQIVLANNDLLTSRIRNYKRMNERRVVFSLGVTYQTPVDKLERVPAMLRSAIEAQSQTRFDRAHFQKFGDFALIFEVVYFVLRPDYNLMMDIQQAINLEIARRFAAEGIAFAYPTQTIFVNNEAEPAGERRHSENPNG